MNAFDPGPGWVETSRSEWISTEVSERISLVVQGRERYWVTDRQVPTLPTDPGYYLTTEPDYGGGPVVVELLNSPAGQWVDAGDRQYLNETQVRDMFPLVRLEPRAVTAKAVLDAFEAHDWDTSARTVENIATEFWVRS